jgi:hypothetical protein
MQLKRALVIKFMFWATPESKRANKFRCDERCSTANLHHLSLQLVTLQRSQILAAQKDSRVAIMHQDMKKRCARRSFLDISQIACNLRTAPTSTHSNLPHCTNTSYYMNPALST